ncbi:MAG: hypothetical protein PVF46_07390 [Lysobacterales bacterium]|jgi:hypothetical protein
MSNDRDMVLQNLFNEADERLDDVAFTSQVVKRTYKLLIRLGLLAACTALVVLAGMVAFGLSPWVVAQGLSEVLTTPVFDVGGGWADWILTPVNNIAGVLVLGFKGLRMLYKKALLS